MAISDEPNCRRATGIFLDTAASSLFDCQVRPVDLVLSSMVARHRHPPLRYLEGSGPVRRLRADWEPRVEPAIRHLQSAWDLQDNSLCRMAEVQDRSAHTYG